MNELINYLHSIFCLGARAGRVESRLVIGRISAAIGLLRSDRMAQPRSTGV
jgi:hypothetical protein